LAGKLRSRHFKFILCRPFFPCDHRPIRPLTVQTLAAPFSFSFVCHSRRESAVALAFAVAPLFVIPEENLLLLLPLPFPPVCHSRRESAFLARSLLRTYVACYTAYTTRLPPANPSNHASTTPIVCQLSRVLASR
jgi:hypothetical protein